MLIVLWELLELVLVVGEAGVHAEIPVRALGQVPRLLRHRLGDVQGRGVLKPGPQPVGVQGNTLLGSSGVWENSAVLRFKELLLDEVLLV